MSEALAALPRIPIDWGASYGKRFRAYHAWSTVHASFDFETQSAAGYLRDSEGYLESLPGLSDQNRGLESVGVVNYVRHPTFSVISLSYDLKDGRGARLWKPGQPPPTDLHEFIERGGVIQSWNNGFEWWVWQLYCAPRLGWPALRVEQVRCVMAKARVFAVPGALADAGPVLRLSNLKDPAGEKLVRKLTVPKNPTKSNRETFWTPHTAPDDFAKFYAYNVQDIIAEGEAALKLPDLTDHELEIWRLDQRINHRGMQIDVKAVENCIAIVEQATQKYNIELTGLTNGAVKKSSEVAKSLAWIKDKFGIYLPNLDEETVNEALDENYPPAVKRLLEIRQKLAFGSVKKLYAMRYHSTPEGRLYDQYSYSAARTRRWNGQHVQPANLYKGELTTPEEVEIALSVIATRRLDLVEAMYEGDALEVVANCLRSLIIAAPGHQLICSDFSAIEGVSAACLAGEQWRIDVFRTHGKIYEQTASDMTGVPFEEILEHKRRTGKHHPHRQPWGKLPELSGQYQSWIGGWKRLGADKLIGADPLIKEAILKWRSKSPMLVNMWGGQTIDKFRSTERKHLYGLEGCAIKAVENPGQCYGYRGILFQVDPINDILYCRPPSGELLPYHAPRLRPSDRPYAAPWEQILSYEGWNSNAKYGAKGWVRMDIYGGKWFENINQHVCRELQAGALIRCDAAGYSIVFHAHDEDCAEVPIGNPRFTIAGLEALMTPTEDWAICDDGLPWPIKASGGWMGPRYGKWE